MCQSHQANFFMSFIEILTCVYNKSGSIVELILKILLKLINFIKIQLKALKEFIYFTTLSMNVRLFGSIIFSVIQRA